MEPQSYMLPIIDQNTVVKCMTGLTEALKNSEITQVKCKVRRDANQTLRYKWQTGKTKQPEKENKKLVRFSKGMALLCICWCVWRGLGGVGKDRRRRQQFWDLAYRLMFFKNQPQILEVPIFGIPVPKMSKIQVNVR